MWRGFLGSFVCSWGRRLVGQDDRIGQGGRTGALCTPDLWVVDKENGGKADALNTGINYCRHLLFCAMDADSLLEPEALTRIVRAFLEDATTVAAGDRGPERAQLPALPQAP